MAFAEVSGGVEYSDDAARIDADRVHAWLREAYWCRGLPRDVMERAFANSMVFGAYDDSGQVAVARVITDKATYAYLCDVYVAEPARGRGIGQALVQFARRHPDLQNLRRWCLLTRDAQSLYERLGFTHLAEPRRYMEIARPGMYERPAT
ncbi:amino-acid N-acetyltransferase [Phycisphaerales bacterium]|nr:amino-acid N-acetyltransferase [Phycisphaerales bacterium]